MKFKNYALCILAGLVFSSSVHAYTKEEVEKRGFLQCGVSTGSPGFSTVDGMGKWAGLDVDMCRAVAAAIFDDADKVEYLPLAEKECFTALLSGEVDILVRHLSWTFTRDTALAVHFVGVNYYDGQGILIVEKLGAEKLADLKKVKVCSPVTSPFEHKFTHYLETEKISFKKVTYDSIDLAVKGLEEGACDVISLQQSQLYGLRHGLTALESAVVLPDVLSREPLGPVVRQGDDTWFNIVRWSLFAMINAEELGITSKNIEEMKISNRLDVQRFFGQEGPGGKGIGLSDDWAVRIIRTVGNYGEVFERNFGSESSLTVERGLNKLWNNGGLLYAPPLR